MPREEKLQIIFNIEIDLTMLILSTASRQKQAVSSHPAVQGTLPACRVQQGPPTQMAGKVLGRAVWTSQ